MLEIYFRDTVKVANPQAETRSLPLDVLRGVAMLLVLFRHPVLPASEAGAFKPVVRLLETIGWTGVDLFFVLSGFLVGGLLFKEVRRSGRVEIRRFLIRRGLKIWPGYFALLAVVFIQQVRHLNQSPGEAFYVLLPNLMHLQNYLGSVRGRTWSLAVEEHFYLLLPVLLWLLVSRKRGRLDAIPAIPFVAVSLAVLCLSLRCWLYFTRPFATNVHLAPTHLRIDSLFWGVLLGYLYEFRPAVLEQLSRRRIPALTCAAALIAPMFVFDLNSAFAHTIGFTMLYLGYGIMVSVFVYTPPQSGLLAHLLYGPFGRGLAFIGVYSYSIFLWHYDCAELVLRERLKWIVPLDCPIELRWTIALVLYIAMATATGFLMAKLIELPALKLRNRLWPSGTVLPQPNVAKA